MSTKKKVITGIVIAVIALIVIAISVTRCLEDGGIDLGGNQNENENTSSAWDEYDGVLLSFATDADCPNGNIDDSKVSNTLTFRKNVVYYMVLDFTIKAESNNDGSGNMFTSISFTNPSVLSATVQEATSGNYEEKTTDDKKTIKITYSVPEKTKDAKKTRIVVKLVPNAEGESQLDITFTAGSVAVSPLPYITRGMAFGYTYGLEYLLSGDTYTVKSMGESNTTDLVIPNVKDGHSVTAIAESAFLRCDTLKSVTIPESVVSIGNGAFNGCTHLTEINYNAVASVSLSTSNNIFLSAGSNTDGLAINIGKNVAKVPQNLFYSAPNATSVRFEEGSICTEIGENAFRGCSSIVSVSFPAGLKTIGGSAFLNCSSLRDFTLPEGLLTINSGAFRGCTSIVSVKFPESLTSICDSSFYGCSSLTSVTLPEGITTLENYAFYNCSAITELNYNVTANMIYSSGNTIFSDAGGNGGMTLTIGKNVKKLPDNTFISAKNIVSLKFEEGSVCTEIGTNEFRGCSKLRSAVLPEGVTVLGNSAFYDCSQLMTVELPDTLGKIGESAFRGCASLTNIDIPDSVTSIGAYAFYSCTSLESITLKENVLELGQSAFYNCTALNEINYNVIAPLAITSGNGILSYAGSNGVGITVNVGNKVKAIPDYMFNSCTNIVSVVFEAGSVCSSIGARAFGGNAKLRTISLPASITSMGSQPFYNCSLLGEINYAGTRAQWSAAVSGVDLAIPASCEIHCIDD